jgi:hypothetical protein
MLRNRKPQNTVEAIKRQAVADAAPDQVKPLSDAQEEQYGAAIAALKRSALGRDPKDFSAALDVAIHHCEKARAFDWPEGEVRRRTRKAAASWNSANAAAKKLAVHLEDLDDLTGAKRLGFALGRVSMQMKTKTPEPLHVVFASLLRALANQVPRRAVTRRMDSGYQIGPLRVGKSSQKLPGREVVLTVMLAHLFDRVEKHDGDGVLELVVGEPISRGRAWEVAADFASAALGPSVDPNAAKKFLHDHRGHLFFQAWPKSRSA